MSKVNTHKVMVVTEKLWVEHTDVKKVSISLKLIMGRVLFKTNNGQGFVQASKR